jgi:ADP-heptose:LPS heptosyltransferase
LAQTAAVLRDAAGVVSVNTGVMHLASCLDVPLVALSGPTSVQRWGPLSGSARNATPATGPCGYLNLGFEYPPVPPACMEAISTDDVVGKLAEVMACV